MTDEQTVMYRVPGLRCDRCKTAVARAVGAVPGVAEVRVDIDAKLVTVRGTSLEDRALRGAIDEAGYDVR